MSVARMRSADAPMRIDAMSSPATRVRPSPVVRSIRFADTNSTSRPSITSLAERRPRPVARMRESVILGLIVPQAEADYVHPEGHRLVAAVVDSRQARP